MKSLKKKINKLKIDSECYNTKRELFLMKIDNDYISEKNPLYDESKLEYFKKLGLEEDFNNLLEVINEFNITTSNRKR